MSPNSPGLQLHHVGIVARDDAQVESFREALGLVEVARERIDKYNVTNIFLRDAGTTKIQFMLQERGVLRNFNQGRGGLHHIAFGVRELERAQAELEARGMRFIAPSPQKGIGDYTFNFAFPHVAGINTEFIQDPTLAWPAG